MPVEAELTDRTEKLTLKDALQITGPLPAVASSQLSLPAGLDVAVRPNEFPAGYVLTAVLDVRNVDATSQLQLTCAADSVVRASLHIGEQTASSSLQRLSPDQLFLSYDTASFPAGCKLEASLDNGRVGRSQPFTVAQLIRLPHIISVTPVPVTGDAGNVPAGLHPYQVTGDNLEMIGKLSWDQNLGVEVAALPAAIPGQGQRQSLMVNLPEVPSTGGSLYLWLRGESSARVTTFTLPPAPAANAAARTSSSPVLH